MGRKLIRRHLTYANVMATLAAVLALAGGAAYAVDKIRSHDVANNSLRSADLKNRKAVRGKDVRPNTLSGRQIDERTLSPGAFVRVAGNETGTECVLQSVPKACVMSAIDVSRPSNLLIVATGNEETRSDRSQASCSVAIDGVEESLGVHPGEVKDNTSLLSTNGFARTLLSRSPLEVGRHVVALRCKSLLGQVRINEPTIAVIATAAR